MPALACDRRVMAAGNGKVALHELASIRGFVDIWYSEATWRNLQEITIRSSRGAKGGTMSDGIRSYGTRVGNTDAKMETFIVNIHERTIPASADAVGRMVDTLGSAGDRVWPHERWPVLTLDRPLQVGAAGGHGPIRYRVESYNPGRRVRFRFLSPEGFVGTHGFDIEDAGEGTTKLRHVIEMRTVGMAVLKWSMILRPLHDALLEDALDKVEGAFRETGPPRTWSRRVVLLRWLVRKSGGHRRYE